MKVVQEKCPVCCKVHTRGEYESVPGSTRVAPRDVKCECGQTLRWAVPIFKTTASGYVLRPLRTDETLFL